MEDQIIINSMMDLAERDKMLLNITRQIKNKQQILIHKYKDYKKTENTNKFAINTTENYKKYYDYIVKEKQDQIAMMKELAAYSDGINDINNLLDEQGDESNYEQDKILKELEYITNELTELTSK